MMRTLSQRSFHSSNLRFEWEIDDFCNRNVSYAGLDSETFDFCGIQWKLCLGTHTNFDNCKNPHHCRITLLKVSPFEAYANIRIHSFIEDRHKKARYCKEESIASSKPWKLVWEMLLSTEEVQSSSQENGAITFIFNFTLGDDYQPLKNTGNKPVQTSINTTAGDSVETLVFDFRRMLGDNALSDVTLKCGDSTIPAHKLILSARSEVFAALLRNDMAESRNGVIEVTDVDPQVLYQLLQFIYSCKLPDMSIDTTPQLYEAADKYGVESLKKDCSVFMKENLTEEYACSILLLADAHSDSDLKGGVVSLIVETKLFQKDDMWLKFCEDHPKLANEVLNRVCKTLSCFV